jgi:hypothetical protein
MHLVGTHTSRLKSMHVGMIGPIWQVQINAHRDDWLNLAGAIISFS